MPKAIVVAVGDTPLNPLNDFLNQNTVSTKIIDAENCSPDETDSLVTSDEQSQCVLVKGVKNFSKVLPTLSHNAESVVLLYCSPTTALTNILEISNGTAKPAQAIDDWIESVNQAIQYAESDSSSLFCDLDDILANPSVFMAEFFNLDKVTELKPSTYTKKLVANHLATLHLFEQDDAFTVYDEALSIGKLFGEFSVHLGPDTDELKYSAIEAGQSVFNQLTNNHQDIQAKNTQLETFSSQSNERIQSLEKQISELQHTKIAFEENSTQLQEQLANSKALAEQQAIKIEALQEDKQSVETKLEAATAQLEKSHNQITGLTSELSAKEESLSESKEQITDLQTKLEDNLQQHGQLQRQIEEFKAAIEKLNEQIILQEQVIAESEKDRAAKTTALQEFESKLHAANQQIEELNSNKDELHKSIQQLKEQLVSQQALNEEKQNECLDTKTELQETQKQLQTAISNVTQLETKQDELKEALVNYKSVNKEMENECLTIRSSLQETQQYLQTAKTRLTELEAQQSELNSTLEQLNGKLDSQQLVIQEKEEALVLKEKRVKELRDQLQTAQQEYSQLEKHLGNLQAQHSEVIASKEQECVKLLNSLTQAQSELKEANISLVTLNSENGVAVQGLDLANLQIAQLQEELEITFSQLQQASTSALKFEQTQSELTALKQLRDQMVQQNELAELQINQLQEELESAVFELQQVRSSALKLAQTESDLTALTQLCEQMVQDKELAELQINQLQQELELISIQETEFQAASRLSEGVIAEKSQQIDVLTRKNEELTAQSLSLKQQVEAAIKRKGQEEQALINELQVQLEQQLKQTQLLENNNARLQEQLNQSEAGMRQDNEFQQVELELASLQISQLQEELEYYYSAWRDALQNGSRVNNMSNHQQKVFTKAQADSLVVTGKYTTDGYQDAHFLLTNLQLGDGRSFSELPVKLVKMGEHVAIEFRDEEQGALFQHYEDSIDEYGPYLRYFGNPPETMLEQQTLIFSRMNSSERVMVISAITLLAELVQQQNVRCDVALSNEEWRNWRLSASELFEIIDKQPNWLSFDSVVLKEEYRTDGYEHLWLSFQNVLLGQFWKEHLELKIAATGVHERDGASFCEDILLEFREADDGTPPLLTWPAETQDEYGSKYVVSIGNIDKIDGLVSIDKLLISHLADNLPSIIDKIEVHGSAMLRSKEDWKEQSVLTRESSKEIYTVDEDEVETLFTIEEVISMGSYQHIVFMNGYQDTKVKLKAQNINPDTFDAELFIEIRNGKADVIYNDTEFFGEDEYGHRVLIPAETYFGEICLNRIAEFQWLVNSYNKAISELETNDSIDELIKRLWLNMLKRKKTLI